jgi:hypothetical protein
VGGDAVVLHGRHVLPWRSTVMLSEISSTSSSL